MDDLAAKLSELLNSPGAVEKVKSLAGLLGGAEAPAQSESTPSMPAQPAPPQSEQSSPLAGLGNLASLGNLGNLGGLGGLAGMDGDMMQMVMKFAPLLSSFRQEDDNTRLLHALRPLLSEERQKKLDEATKLLQLIRLLPLLKGSGIF